MVIPNPPDPVKLFVGMLSMNVSLFKELEHKLTELFGPMDYRSDVIPFNHTDYYEPEMGPGLKRYFVAFEKLVDPGTLASIKLRTNELESRYSSRGKRRINLDPGYLDFHKIVLASGKYGGPKIYLSNGIYADMTLRFSHGRFQPMDWGFPDFKTGSYNHIFMEMRRLYKSGIRLDRNGEKV